MTNQTKAVVTNSAATPVRTVNALERSGARWFLAQCVVRATQALLRDYLLSFFFAHDIAHADEGYKALRRVPVSLVLVAFENLR